MAIPVIYKGDTSGSITLNIASGYDYTGCTLRVVFNGVLREFTGLVAGGTVTMAYTAGETDAMPLGTAPAYLSLRNAAGTVRTMPWARIKVTDAPGEVYDTGITIDPSTLDIDDPTAADGLGDVKRKLKQVMDFLRGGAALAVALCCGVACADLSPTNTLNDVPGTTTISNLVLAAGVQPGGGVAANVLHYTRSTSSFAEDPQTVARYVTEAQPLFCLVDGYIWFKLDNAVQQTVSGVTSYTLTFACDNASNSAAGIYKPWLMTVLAVPSTGYCVAQIAQASMLADSLAAMTNSAAFRNAVAAVTPPPAAPVVTNLYNAAGNQFIDGDLELYQFVSGSAWTNDTAGGYGQIPAGLRYEQNGPNRWTANNGGSVYDIYYDDGTYRLMKDDTSAFPRSTRSGTPDTTVLEFDDFSVYRIAGTPHCQRTDAAAKVSYVQDVSNRFEQALLTDVLKAKIGAAKSTGMGWSSYGLVSYDTSQPNFAFTYGYWNLTIYPQVKAWVNGEIASNGMPGHGLLLTNGVVKTKSGTVITAADVGAISAQQLTNAALRVANRTWDDGYQILWEKRAHNGGFYEMCVTNVDLTAGGVQ